METKESSSSSAMKRFTTDIPSNNTETMLNLAYVQNDYVEIRGMEESFIAYIRTQCKKHGCDLSNVNDDETCEAITTCSYPDSECPIFLLFMVATQAAETRERLKMYENLNRPLI